MEYKEFERRVLTYYKALNDYNNYLDAQIQQENEYRNRYKNSKLTFIMLNIFASIVIYSYRYCKGLTDNTKNTKQKHQVRIFENNLKLAEMEYLEAIKTYKDLLMTEETIICNLCKNKQLKSYICQCSGDLYECIGPCSMFNV